MKTYLIAIAASAAFISAAIAAEAPAANTNMQPAPAATAASTEAAPGASANATPADRTRLDASTQAPAAVTASTSDEGKGMAQTAGKDGAMEPKKVDEHHAKYHGGEGSTWKMGRNTYGFEGSYGGCQFRGHAGPDGYHIDRSC